MEQALLDSAQNREPVATGNYYVTFDRFDRPKETTKFFRDALEKITEPGRSYSMVDIGCANGEMIYHFQKKFPNWSYYGLDHLPAYIDSANQHPLFRGSNQFRFETKGLYDVEGQYDIVALFGTMHLFWDHEPVLDKLLSLTKPGGYVLVDEFFSRDEIEVRLMYRDKSNPLKKDEWVRDFPVRTQSGLREYLADKASSVTFHDIPMVEIPRDPDAVHIRTWTFRDAEGRNRTTNGTGRLLDRVLMVAKKL
jgi:trans-aconitate methyltransferase